MTQVNLLPPEVKTRQRVRRYTLASTGAVAAAVVLLLMVFVVQTVQLGDVEESLAAQQQVNRGLQAQITDLQPVAELHAQVQSRQELADSLLADQVVWSSVLRNVSAALPGGLWLTSMTGSLNPTAPGTALSTGGPAVVGNIQFHGQSFEHVTVGSWLTRLEQVPGWVNAWVTSSTKDAPDQPGNESGGRRLVTFTNSVDLTEEATVDRRQA
jgi:Tfp pilus assembly protein PilN